MFWFENNMSIILKNDYGARYTYAIQGSRMTSVVEVLSAIIYYALVKLGV
jgi:hypothetical protein